VSFKITDEEFEVLEWIRDARGFKTITDAFRDIIRLARVLFDERLTIERAFKPSMLKLLRESEEVAKTVPLIDALKTIPQMEKELDKAERSEAPTY
jgi:hypothetical protein